VWATGTGLILLQEATEDAAAKIAAQDLDQTLSAGADAGRAREFAIVLRACGYKKLDDFRIAAQGPLELDAGQDEVFEEVSFLTAESGTDLIVSYAIEKANWTTLFL
jgi:hypothetical protein